MFRSIICLTAALSLAVPMAASQAASGTSGDLVVSGAFARATPPGSTVSSVYFTITNQGDEEHIIVGARSDVASVVEIHAHRHDEETGTHQMRRVENAAVPARGRLEFEPGGLHIMLIDLEESLETGDEITVTLVLDDGAEVLVIADVRRPGRDQEQRHHH